MTEDRQRAPFALLDHATAAVLTGETLSELVDQFMDGHHDAVGGGEQLYSGAGRQPRVQWALDCSGYRSRHRHVPFAAAGGAACRCPADGGSDVVCDGLVVTGDGPGTQLGGRYFGLRVDHENWDRRSEEDAEGNRKRAASGWMHAALRALDFPGQPLGTALRTAEDVADLLATVLRVIAD